MLESIEKLLVSRYGLLATSFAGMGSLMADALGGGNRFYIVFAITAFILLWGYLEERKKSKLYKDGTVPIPIVINVNDNTSTFILLDLLVAEIEKSDPKFKKHKENLEKYFNITHDMLMFKYDGDMYDNDRLISFLQIIRYELNDIQNRLKGNAQFHVYYLKRPAFGIVIGGMFARDGIIVYQNNDSQNAIDRVATINSRQYKETVKKYEYFKIVKDFNDREDRSLLIIIQIASHKVSRNNESFKDFKNVLMIESKGNATIPIDKDNVDSGIWIAYAQEIYNIINNIKDDYDNITIAHAMPEAIAIILGMGLENYWNITVTQYDNGHYPKVINLQQVKYYF